MKDQPALRKNGAHGVEVMDHAVVTGVFDRDACGHQLACVGIAFIAQRVKFGSMDNGGRETRQTSPREAEKSWDRRGLPLQADSRQGPLPAWSCRGDDFRRTRGATVMFP